MAIGNIYTNSAPSGPVNVTIGASGNSRRVIALVSGSHWEPANHWSTATLNGVAGTSIAAGGAAEQFKAQAFYWDDADLPASAGTYAVSLNSGEGNGRQISVFYGTGVKQSAPVSITSGGDFFGPTSSASPAGDDGRIAFMTCAANMSTGTITFSANETVISSGVAAWAYAHTYDAVDASVAQTFNNEFRAFVAFAIEPAASTPAPTLSAGASSNVTQTTATVGATTDQNTGTLYLTLTTTAADRDAVTATQVTDGQQDSGAAAQFATSGAITTTSPSIPLTGLTPGTTYYWDIAQENGNGISNLQSGSFTTAAASRTVTVIIRSRATGTLLNAQARRFWTRLTLSGAAVDGGTDGLDVTCNASGEFDLTGLTIAAGAGYVTYHDPADSTKSINIPVTFLAGT